MLRRSWLMVAVAAWLALAMSARAQEPPPKFEPLEFVADPSDGSATIERLALASEKSAELTFVRGARPVQGIWSIVGGPRIRFLGSDGTVRLFSVGAQEVHLAGGGTLAGGRTLASRKESPWLDSVAADPARRNWPTPALVMTTGAEVCDLERHADGQADWTWEDHSTVAVQVEEKGPNTLSVRFPDGTSRALVRKGPGWEDTTPGVAKSFSEKRARLTCLMNLKQLADIFVVMRSEKPGRPKYDGTALFLSFRKSERGIRRGEESVLICPGDRAALPLGGRKTRDRYDEVDLANPTPGLCSYAGRDFSSFPLSSESQEKEPIACCRQGADGRTPHHEGGICVAYDDASAAFCTPSDLGLAPGDPIVVGADSKSPVLRKMIFVKKR